MSKEKSKGISEGISEGRSKKSYGNLKRSESMLNSFTKDKVQVKKEKEGDTAYSISSCNHTISSAIVNKKQEENAGLDSILQFLPDKNDNDLLKENDDFITTDQDVHILDNEKYAYKISLFLENNDDINYVLDVMSSVLINNKNILFHHLKDCFGYDFKENIKEHIHLSTTREKLAIFNKNLLIKNIQFLDSRTYNNIKELQEKQPTDLLNIIFKLNKKKYPNKSVLNYLENTLNSVICMPEVEIDFLTNILPDIDISHSDLEKFVKTRYNNQSVKSQVPMEKLVKLNRILLMKNILEIQEKNITDKNKIIDYETLSLLSDKELECIKTDLVAKIKKVQTIKKNYFENFPVLQEATINKSMPDKTQEIDKTPIISSIKQLSQYATDTEYKLTGHTDKKDCFNDNVLKQLSVDTLQQINNNLLIYKFMEQKYCRLLTNENSNYINTYNNLSRTISVFKDKKLSKISFI